MKDAVTVLKMTSRLELKDSISKTELQNKRISKNIFTRSYHAILEEYATGTYGYGTISLLGQSCFASISAMLVLMNPNQFPRPIQMIQLFLVTIFCIGFNAMVISQQRARVQVNVLLISIFTSLIFLCINLI